MLLREVDCFSWLVHALIQVPYVEIFRSVDDKEFAKTVHKSTSQSSCITVSIIVHGAPVDTHDGVLASVEPDCDGRSVLVVEYSRLKLHIRL